MWLPQHQLFAWDRTQGAGMLGGGKERGMGPSPQPLMETQEHKECN